MGRRSADRVLVKKTISQWRTGMKTWPVINHQGNKTETMAGYRLYSRMTMVQKLYKQADTGVKLEKETLLQCWGDVLETARIEKHGVSSNSQQQGPYALANSTSDVTQRKWKH